PRELLLDETNQLLVVLSEITDVYSIDPSQSFGWTVSIVDVANPANPLLLGTLNLEGSLFAARRIGSRVHLFSRKSLVVPGSFYEDGGTELLNQYFEAVNNEDETLIGFYEDALRTFIADIVSTNSSTFRPTYSELNGAQQVVACDNIDAPVVPVEYGITSILSFDTDGSDVDIAAVVSNAFGAYVSTGNAYLVQSSYGWFWDPAQADETAIYKYQLGDGVATYQALATVPGQVVNNLAMSEHDDVLRIATTEIAYDNSEAPRFYQTNHLHTLADNGQGQLEVLGAILDFELDENIRSARFVGDVGYVVTFRQIDPLFTFDLSDPANPQLMGALELPGFSTYIHPVGESHLLTLGFADVIDNNVTAMALRIFNVSDLSAPRLDHTYVIDPEDEAFNNGWSSALYDHRAFTYDDGLLALPLKSWSADNPFTGFAFFGIDLDAGITDLGRLSHNDVIQQSVSAWRCETFGDCDATQSVISGAPSRTIFVTTPAGRYIHSVSEGGLKITPANDPVQVLNTVVFDL
ncbi:MAG: beta-propeller domain-containing protein, partial [Gammaproteobacteria bacterium]|nr:beta-propeller domain-containing protein [Gammaproteobacteria bacterium]